MSHLYLTCQKIQKSLKIINFPNIFQETTPSSYSQFAKDSFRLKTTTRPRYYFNYDINTGQETQLSSSIYKVGNSNNGHFISQNSRFKKSDQNFGHSEIRSGSETRGRYYVNLPDGRTQIVEYYADETGYHPTITYVNNKSAANRHFG